MSKHLKVKRFSELKRRHYFQTLVSNLILMKLSTKKKVYFLVRIDFSSRRTSVNKKKTKAKCIKDVLKKSDTNYGKQKLFCCIIFKSIQSSLYEKCKFVVYC